MKNDPDHPYPIGMARNDSIYELSLLYSDYKHRAEAAEVRATISEKSFNDTLIDLKAMMQERDDYGRKYSALVQATQEREAELRSKLEQALKENDRLNATIRLHLSLSGKQQ